MSALVAFDRIRKAWQPSKATFEIVFGALYELYLDPTRAPDICADLRPRVGTYLHECWPEKYVNPGGNALDCVLFSRYPNPQKPELLRAAEQFLRIWRMIGSTRVLNGVAITSAIMFPRFAS